MYDPGNFIMMPIPADKFTAVCALLGGAVILAAGGGNVAAPGNVEAAPSGVAHPIAEATTATTSSTTTDASPSDGEIDAHGHPWSAELHASTKGKTKDGLWRMKVGVSRPDPLPGFPTDNGAANAGTGTNAETASPSATLPTATDQGSGQSDISGADEEDEFAAFRNAAAASDAGDAAAAASIPARAWSDGDLGALCNQAAVKLGDPTPVKELIAQYVPAGEVAHSRNIPADQREAFAKSVEAKAGIEFAG